MKYFAVDPNLFIKNRVKFSSQMHASSIAVFNSNDIYNTGVKDDHFVTMANSNKDCQNGERILNDHSQKREDRLHERNQEPQYSIRPHDRKA